MDGSTRLGLQAAAVGGGAVAAGSFLPWLKVTAPFVGTITKSGMEGGDGIISLALGLVVVACALAALNGVARPKTTVVMLVAGIAAVALAGFEWRDISNRFADVDSEFVATSVGAGLWLIGLGGATAAAVALKALTPDARPAAAGDTGSAPGVVRP